MFSLPQFDVRVFLLPQCLLLQLNYQRDQVAALKAKRQEKGEKYGEKDAEQMSRVGLLVLGYYQGPISPKSRKVFGPENRPFQKP